MPIRWIPVEQDTPEPGERVMVKNSIHVWDTVWKPILADPALPAPILAWSREEVGALENSKAKLDEDAVQSAQRQLNGYYKTHKRKPRGA